MRKKVLLLSVTFALVILTGCSEQIVSIGEDEVSASVVGKDDLVQEFNHSYRKDFPKSVGVKEFKMVAAESEIEIFDGYQTQVWSYNSQVPGPELRIKLGETVKMNFENNLKVPTTIHWHGIRLANGMDGVPDITQKPIQPGEKFVYEFMPKDAGTFWFHPHVRGSEELERGLYGVLIVEDEYVDKYSQDVVWVIDDWLLTRDAQVNPNFNTMHDLMHDGRWGNVMTVNGKQREVLQAQPGERIRLRLVNTSNARVYVPMFYGLRPQVIAVDGMYVKEPFDLDRFDLSPGNRIDLDIVIPEEENTYKMYDIFGRENVLLAEIDVRGQPVETPQFVSPRASSFPDSIAAVHAPVDKEYVLNAQRSSGGGHMMRGGIDWAMNGLVYPENEAAQMNIGEFYKVRFTNDSYRLHPMHIHGLFFKVIARNGQPVNEEFWRDTVLVGSRETVDIAFVPWDEGRWVNHCHIQEHAEAGMMTLLEIK